MSDESQTPDTATDSTADPSAAETQPSETQVDEQDAAVKDDFINPHVVQDAHRAFDAEFHKVYVDVENAVDGFVHHFNHENPNLTPGGHALGFIKGTPDKA